MYIVFVQSDEESAMPKGSEISQPPVTRRDNLVERIHGVEVADPYRWLEDANSPGIREWLAVQQKHAAIYFASTERELIHRRLAELMRIDAFGIPHEVPVRSERDRKSPGQP
jgi:prolyl oligopeptidase